MKFRETSKIFSLNKSTYVNLRWIAYLGQLITIFLVQFILKFKFDYISCIFVIFISVLSNLYLNFKIKENQLSNFRSSLFLTFDILQLSILFFFTGGITNPFIFLIIIPAVFSSQYLSIKSSVILVFLTTFVLFVLTFFFKSLPSPDVLHFHAPNYYLYSIPVAIFIGLTFLVYFGVRFGNENRIRKEAYDKMQEIMAKENELISLGGQAAAAAHSLGTPLSTILLTSKELQKEFGKNKKIKNDLDLLVSQSNRCSAILKKLTLNPNIEDEFFDNEISMDNYIKEIVRSYQEISDKKFVINLKEFKNKVKSYKSPEIVYGLRNFIGNANKFSIKRVDVFLTSNREETEIIVKDDGPGFPIDLIDKSKLGEPYIRTKESQQISKYGLGLGTFIGKTLLERNFAKVSFKNSKNIKGAEVKIKWLNKDLKKIN
tara:strand:- start:270 stop:1559 length:1290 start_codon:yes stop_codon:yes gene_type:complete